RSATPPQENGRRLATIGRSKDEELRVNWSEYEGKPYLSIRLWTRDDSGGWWPSKTVGCTVRLRELPDVADAIAEALGLAEEHQSNRGPAPRPATNNRRNQSDAPFDEFGGGR